MTPRHRIALSPDARDDIRSITRYYDNLKPGLGRRFRLQLIDALEAAVTRPASFAVVHRDIRRSLLRRFPYGVFFFLDADVVRVIAVVHLARHPRTWHARR